MSLSPRRFTKSKAGVPLSHCILYRSIKMNRLVITVLYIILSACAHQQEPPPLVVVDKLTPPLEPISCPHTDEVGMIARNEVGVAPLKDKQTSQQPVQQKYACEKNHSPYVVIERNELFPVEPQAGKEFKHCFIYTVCDSEPSTPHIKATLKRKVLHGKKTKFQDTSKEIEIKPGRWTDVARITPPLKTKPGSYIFQLSFSFLETTIIRDLSFKIRK